MKGLVQRRLKLLTRRPHDVRVPYLVEMRPDQLTIIGIES